MSNRYSVAPADVQKRVKKIAGKFHKGLVKGRARLDVLFVTPQEDDDGAPIKQWGGVQVAKTRIISQRDRGAGRGDAEILIDARCWDGLTPAQRDAVVDRQLSFLKVKTDDEGNNVLDGNDRVKLIMQRPTRIFAWFDDVAKRHGENSVEVQEANELIAAGGAQLYFPGMEPPKASRRALPAASGQVIEMTPAKDAEKIAAK